MITIKIIAKFYSSIIIVLCLRRLNNLVKALKGTNNRLLTIQSEQSRSAGDALIIRRAVTGLAGRMARCAIVILRFVRIGRTRGITFVLMHHQMMLAAGTLVRSVLAAGAVGLAWHARAVLGVCTKECKNHTSRYSISILKRKNEGSDL